MPRVQEGCCIASPRTVLLFCSDILLDLKCEPQSFNRKMKPVQLCSNPSAVMVSPRQHIVSLALLPNNITACLKTTKNYYSWKPAILHCMGADNSSLRPPTFYFITIVPFCRRNIPLAVSICSISSTRPLAVGKSIPTLCCLMRFFKYPPSSSACLDLCVCAVVCESQLFRAAFVAGLDSAVIRDHCSYALFNSLGRTGTPAPAGQSHPGVFWECQDGEK